MDETKLFKPEPTAFGTLQFCFSMQLILRKHQQELTYMGSIALQLWLWIKRTIFASECMCVVCVWQVNDLHGIFASLQVSAYFQLR